MAFEGYPPKPVTSAKMTGVGNQGYTEGCIKVDNMREMPGKPLISVMHIFLPRSFWPMSPAWVDDPSKTTMRGLQGRDTPLSWYSYYITSSDDQPRNSRAGDFVTSHKAYIISAVRFCLICGKHITCEVSRGYRARDSACFAQ